jgi:hypothetical protein
MGGYRRLLIFDHKCRRRLNGGKGGLFRGIPAAEQAALFFQQ